MYIITKPQMQEYYKVIKNKSYFGLILYHLGIFVELLSFDPFQVNLLDVGM